MIILYSGWKSGWCLASVKASIHSMSQLTWVFYFNFLSLKTEGNAFVQNKTQSLWSNRIYHLFQRKRATTWKIGIRSNGMKVTSYFTKEWTWYNTKTIFFIGPSCRKENKLKPYALIIFNRTIQQRFLFEILSASSHKVFKVLSIQSILLF